MKNSRSWVFFFILSIVFLLFIGYAALQYKNSVHFKIPSGSNVYKKRIYDKISFNIPDGWKEIEPTSDNSIMLVSNDYKPPNLSRYFLNGAEITLYREPSSAQNGDLEQEIDMIYNPEDQNIRNAKKSNYPNIAGRKAINVYDCWEGCKDIYFFLNGTTLWSIYFTCANGCDIEKKDLDKTPYARAKDEFLMSLKLR